MKSNYKRIGDYIRLVDNRNTDLSVKNLLGLSITKEFVPSVANTVGTDMSKYKVVKKNQFVCSTMQVRRDKKMPVALLQHVDEGIISPAYYVFEVIDEDILLPEYLMMWFSRSEFDREACFYAIGGVRGSLEWEDFCDMKLPIPSIEKQREIVKEYNVILNRIRLNENKINNLEILAKSIYSEWFENQEYDEDKIVTKIKLENLCNIGSSKRVYFDEYTDIGVPFYRGGEIILEKNSEPIKNELYISDDRYNELEEKYGAPNYGDILLTAVGTIGQSWFVDKERFYFKDGNVIWLSGFKDNKLNYYIYSWMQSETFNNIIKDLTIGSTQSAITIKDISKIEIILPEKEILDNYINLYKKIMNNIILSKKQKMKLLELKSILLCKIASMEV